MTAPLNLSRGRAGSARFRRRRYCPVVEILEDRLVLTTTVGPIYANPATDWRDMTFTIDDQLPTDYATSGSVTAQDMQFAQQIGLTQAMASYPYRGAGYTVAVIDTGIDYNNPALGGGWGKRVIAGWNFVANDSNPMDDNGHGTFVAGMIGSSNATYPGIAPDVDFVALKVLDSTGTGTYGNVDLALQWVAAHQAEYNIVAVNMSLGSGNYTTEPYTFLDADFQALVKEGVFIAVAAGNDYYTYGSAPGLAFPAVNPSVVSVGALWDGNYGTVTWVNGAEDYVTAPNLITSFTQRDSSLDILAPGAMVTSTYLNDTFTTMAGTSMATPVIAASSVLIREGMDALGMHSLANEQDILNVMQQTGTTINDGDPSHDNVVNTGLNFKSINLYAALQSLTTDPPSDPVTPPPSNSPTLPPVLGTLNNISMYSGQTQTITLSATDPNGYAVQFSAQAVGLASQAYQLKVQYGLTYAGSYYYDSWGADEKWLLGTGGQWFLLTPDGDLREFTGNITTSLEPSAVVASLGVAYYNDPSLLWDAAAPTAPPVTASVSGNQLSITAPSSYTGTFQVNVTANDGHQTATGSFQVTVGTAPTVTAPAFQNLGNVTFSSSQSSGTITLNAIGPAGAKLVYSAALASASAQAVQLQKSLGLYYLGGYFQNLDGQNEKWLGGSNGKLYFLLPNGQLYNYASTMTAALAGSPVATLSAAFYANPQLLLAPVQPTLKISGNVLTVGYPLGYTGSFQVQVTVTAGSATATQVITVTVANPSSGTSLDLAAPAATALTILPGDAVTADENAPVVYVLISPASNASPVNAPVPGSVNSVIEDSGPTVDSDADVDIGSGFESAQNVDGIAAWLADSGL